MTGEDEEGASVPHGETAVLTRAAGPGMGLPPAKHTLRAGGGDLLRQIPGPCQVVDLNTAMFDGAETETLIGNKS